MSTYKVVRADLRTDRATIVDQLVRNEPDMPRQSDQVAWHLERNPHGEGRCWLLLAEPEGKAIGVSCVVLRRMQVNGEVHLAGRTWGISVDKEHRSLGPALLLAKASLGELDRDLSFLYVLPYRKTACAVFTRAGYQKLGSFDRYVRVLRSKQYLRDLPQHRLAQHRLLQHRALQHPFVQSALSGPIADLLAPPADLLTYLAFDKPWQRPRDLSVSCISGFDRRFDDLWQRARSHYAVISERSAETLGWRFRRSWDTHLTLGFYRPGAPEGPLAGYAMLSFHGTQALLLDFFVEDPAGCTAAALWLLVDWARSHGFQSISFSLAETPELCAELRRRWFIKITAPVPSKQPAKANDPNDEIPGEVLAAWPKTRERFLPDLKSWHFTFGDDI